MIHTVSNPNFAVLNAVLPVEQQQTLLMTAADILLKEEIVEKSVRTYALDYVAGMKELLDDSVKFAEMTDSPVTVEPMGILMVKSARNIHGSRQQQPDLPRDEHVELASEQRSGIELAARRIEAAYLDLRYMPRQGM